ncbi:MAG TPA: hydroxymethylglutaryl-CoA lyase [Phycisphaerales bacterium]|nr:hydroxymethylglutaryl-CoA lyase [Phycisphaerales bacterium]
MPDRVRITDVAPRDGLQNEPGFVPTAQKAALVRAIAASGVDEVEITSFVSPKRVPQLADAAALCDLLREDKPAGVLFSALAPNEQGLGGVLAANDRAGRRLIDKVSVFTAASESFSRNNTNATIDETLARFAPVVRTAHGAGLVVRGYVSCVVACPFEGPIDPWAVAAVAGRLADLGIEEIDLGDTIGAGSPETVGRVISTALEYLDESHGWSDASRLTLHLHDTGGRASECVRVALELGVRSFDGATGGLGGCPYASTPGRRAPGNLSTVDLVDAVERAGLRHRVDRSRLDQAEAAAADCLGSARGSGARP